MTAETTPVASALAREVAREQEVLDRALARLDVLRGEAQQREAESMRPTGGSPQAVYERDVSAQAAANRRADLDSAGEGLVFGRLDRDDGTVHHIGRTGLRTDQQEPIVVDWRAPAAAAFYRATAADPQGVVRRRTISTRRSTVIGVDDELLDADGPLEGSVVVGDGAFLAAVSRERTGQMQDIVATIQREQDEAVRAPDDGALVVTGGPGTGKTAVALHRVAYLMYARREWYSRRGVLVVGPSPVFVDYIGAVLPALGETSVRLASLADLPELPRGIEVTGYDGPAALAVKGSARMADLLRKVVRHLGGARHLPDLDVDRWGVRVTVRGSEIARRRAAVHRSSRSHNSGRQAFAAALVELAWRAWERRPQATRMEADDREDFGAWIRHDPAFRRALDAAWPVLLPWPVLTRLRDGSLPLADLARGILSDEELRALQTSWAGDPPLTAADAALHDELVELLGAAPVEVEEQDDGWDELADLDARAEEIGVTTHADRTARARRNLAEERDYRTYAHVVVDESQDVTPMQWRMLGRRARGATWTVVGDWVQSAWPDVQEVRDALAAVLGKNRLRQVELTTNYRTTTEVAALAARLLARIDPALEAPKAVRSSGIEPLLITGSGVGGVLSELPERVATLLAQVGGTVGVVAPYRLVEQIRDVLPHDPRVTVVDPWQVKGLEYDGCLVADPHGIVEESQHPVAGLRSLYVALTRATQRLVVVGAEPLDTLLLPRQL